MATQTMEPKKRQNETPAWVGVMIAALLGIGLLGGTGWWLWSYLHQPKQGELAEYNPNGVALRPGRVGNGPRMVRVPQPVVVTTGVMKRDDNNYLVRAGTVVMSAMKPQNADKWNLRLNYAIGNLVAPDQAAALLARFRLTSDPSFAKSLNVNDDQLAKLKDIPAGTGMVVSDDNKAKVQKLWDDYLAANPKTDAEKALVDAIKQVGQDSLDPTKSAIDDRAKKVEAILTPEQIAPFKQ